MNDWLECQVTNGMFSTEFAVSGERYDGKGFSLFALKEDVRSEHTPNGSPVSGYLRIMRLKEKNNLILVQLPQPSFQFGPTVTVNVNQLHCL